MTPAQRPLSPHLQIYKWQLTSLMSIGHRLTGIALTIGTIFLVWWLLAAASGDASFDAARWFFGSWLGLLMLLGWCFCFFYHLCNGLRHLAWDFGYGFEIPNAYASGYAVVAASVVLTLIAFIAGLAGRS
jgi:succinate dehydrogenase / fumarate reductase, cytochrome b subunit